MTQIESITDITYVTRNGQALKMDIHRPVGATAPLPVVVGIPGGGWRGCAKEGVPRFLVEQGFAMACINYRVSAQAIAPANIYDCKAAVRWLRANAGTLGLDPERIGAYGGSAGGHLTALLATSSGNTALEEDGGDPALSAVQAACAVCGPTDLTRIAIPEIRAQFPLLYEVTADYLGGPVAERAALARLVSPLTYVSRNTPPLLLFHGLVDDVVPYEETTIFHAALQRAGAVTQMRLVDGVGHDMLVSQVAEEVITFFDRHLRA